MTFEEEKSLGTKAVRHNHGAGLGALWSIPVGCLLGTAIALVAFFVVFGFMRLTGLA